MSILVAIIIFALLVFIHELGHFYAAKKNGIAVLEFAIGMGPKIFSFKKAETLYSVRLFPIGGYCSMLGEDTSSTDERAFNNKKVWQRMIVVVAGAFANFALAFVCALIINSFYTIPTTTVNNLMPDYPLAQSGVQVGDTVVQLNDTKVKIYDEIKLFLYTHDGSPINITVDRAGQAYEFAVTPQKTEYGYILGFQPLQKAGMFSVNPQSLTKANVLETFTVSTHTVKYYIKSTVIGFAKMLTFQVDKEEMAGPIGIVSMVGNTYQESVKEGFATTVGTLLTMMAALSANLGAINLLPIPAMDGGRFVFLMLEAIRKKPFDRDKEGMVHLVGFAVLICFMVYIGYNDIVKLFG